MALLENNVAIVTGGGRGIGRSIALKLASAGCAVVVSDIVAASAGDCAKVIAESGRSSLAVTADVSDSAEVEALVGRCLEKFGTLDILVNNAGITRDSLLIRMSEEDWDRVIDINLKGVFNCLKAAARVMIKRRYGRIINIASVVGIVGNAGQGNYTASKAGVIGLTKTAARELGARGINVNAIAPGFIETDMTRDLSEEIRHGFLTNIPLKRTGTPDDVAEAVVFLASPASAYITGQVLHVDGGMVM